jgi:hypothetical protein
VALGSFTIGDNVKSDNVVISMRNKGREEQDLVQGRIGVNLGEGSGHDDEVEWKLEDHRGSQGAYSSARQPDRPVTGAADENDNDEDGCYGCKGNGRDGIRRPGVRQVIAVFLLTDEPYAAQKRCNSNDPGCEHNVRGFLAGSWCPDRQRQPGSRIRRASRGDQQHEGEHDPGGAAI